MDRDHNRTNEIVVDLGKRSIKTWKHVPGVQPSVVIEEYSIVPEIVRADARWQEAMRKRGITNLENVKVDAWAPGHLGDLADGPRIVRAIFFYKENDDSNSVALYERSLPASAPALQIAQAGQINTVTRSVIHDCRASVFCFSRDSFSFVTRSSSGR